MLKGLSKLKSMKRLPGLGKPVKQQPLPDLDEGPQRIESTTDNELTNLANRLEDMQLAKRVLKLKKKFFNTISGTIIELIIMDYLERRNYKYEYQKWILGGRALRGGQVVDFAVDVGTRVVVIEPQGEYWHTRPGKIQMDAAQKLALMGIEIWGKPVVVVEIWERRLMGKHTRQQALDMAMMGIELGR
jgi:hypothetical protein